MKNEDMTSWAEELSNALSNNEESMKDLISNTLSAEDLQIKFDSGYGGVQGVPFTAWTEKYVYFPVVYDGAEWVGGVPRNPCDKVTQHVGGG